MRNYRQNIGRKGPKFRNVVALAALLAPVQASAASVTLFSEHHVSEFSEPTGVVAQNEFIGPTETDTFVQDLSYTSIKPCCVTGSVSGYFATVGASGATHPTDQFGSKARIRTVDVRSDVRTISAGGQLVYPAKFRGDLADNFRISNTKLKVRAASTARLKFVIAAHEIVDQSKSEYPVNEVLMGPTLKLAQYSAELFGGDYRGEGASLTISQSGFDVSLPEPDFYLNRSTGYYEWDFGSFAGNFDLSSFGYTAGTTIGMSYTWGVEVEGNFEAFASFYDPLSGDGGISFDRVDKEILPTTNGVSAPAPVPLPAGGLLLLSGLISFWLRTRRIDSRS